MESSGWERLTLGQSGSCSQIPQRLIQTCVCIFCRGSGHQWPAAGAGVPGTATCVTQSMEYALLEEVDINPNIEPPSR